MPFLLIGFLILQSLALLTAMIIAWPVNPAEQPQPAPLPDQTPVAIVPTLPILASASPLLTPSPLTVMPALQPTYTPMPQPTNTPIPQPPALRLRGLEITQSIQVFNEPELPQCNPNPIHPHYVFCNNSIPLVAGRHTLVRVYPTCAESCPATDVTLTLRLFKDGQERASFARTLSAATLQRINNLALPELRLHLENSVNFEFFPPPDWLVGQVTFDVHALPQGELNKSPATLALSKEFVARKVLKVAYLPVTYQGLRPSEPAGLDYWLLRLYPVAAVQYYRLPVPDLAWSGELNKAEILRKLLYTYWLYVQNQPAEAWPDQLFGWLPQESYNGGASDPFWCPNCAGVHSSRVAFGGLRPEQDIGGPRILVHEIAHNLGAQHAWSPTQREDAACFKAEGADISVDPDWPYIQTPHTQEVGIDLYSNPPVVYPASAYDMMAYCAQPWISPHTYRKIFNSPFLQPDNAALPWANLKPQIQTSSAGTLLVSGVVYRNGTVSQPEIIQLDGAAFANVPGFTPPPGDDYCVNVYGHDQTLLTQRCFEVGFTDVETGLASAESSPYFLTLTDIDPATVAKISLSQNQTSLEAPASVVTPSQNPPSLAIESPNGGETLTGQITVSWLANDPDGDSLRYDLLYSPDNGQSWLPLAVQLTEAHSTFFADQLPPSSTGLMRVIASDGFHTSLDHSDAPFSVAANLQPGLHLEAPAIVKTGQTFDITLMAHQVPQPGLYGLQFKLHFDPAKIQINNIRLHPDLNLVAQQTLQNEAGLVAVVASRQGPLPGLSEDMTLATFTVTATQNQGVLQLNLDEVIPGAPDGTRLSLQTTPSLAIQIAP
jgi:hypothetical protein